jgi:hypothetical protein
MAYFSVKALHQYKVNTEYCKSSRGGVVGITTNRMGGKLYYIAKLPLIIGNKTKCFRCPVKAAEWYNKMVSKKLKDNSILCDVDAVKRLYEVKGEQVS